MHTRIDQAPASIQQMAISLSALQPVPVQGSLLPKLLVLILSHFEAELSQLRHDDPSLSERWNRLNLLCDQVVRVALGPQGSSRERCSGSIRKVHFASTTASRYIGSLVGRCYGTIDSLTWFKAGSQNAESIGVFWADGGGPANPSALA